MTNKTNQTQNRRAPAEGEKPLQIEGGIKKMKRQFNVAVLAGEEFQDLASEQLGKFVSANFQYITDPKQLEEDLDGILTEHCMNHPKERICEADKKHQSYDVRNVLPIFVSPNTPRVYCLGGCPCGYFEEIPELQKEGIKWGITRGTGFCGMYGEPLFDRGYNQLNLLMRMTSKTLREAIKSIGSARHPNDFGYTINREHPFVEKLLGKIVRNRDATIGLDSLEKITLKQIEKVCLA